MVRVAVQGLDAPDYLPSDSFNPVFALAAPLVAGVQPQPLRRT